MCFVCWVGGDVLCMLVGVWVVGCDVFCMQEPCGSMCVYILYSLN